jgi:hypothetical protein
VWQDIETDRYLQSIGVEEGSWRRDLQDQADNGPPDQVERGHSTHMPKIDRWRSSVGSSSAPVPRRSPPPARRPSSSRGVAGRPPLVVR